MPQTFHQIYEFVRELGEGSFGRVFLAREAVSQRLVAIKQLHRQDAARQQDIIREIQTVSRLNHPQVVTYHHHFCEEGLLFLVMEYCSGGSMRDVLARRKFTAGEALTWIQSLADALAFVHSKGIVHHDIKPDNILLTDTGALKLSDFGIANVGGGTRAYMSPQALAWDDRSIGDPRVDIYALGVTLMELLTGANPFFCKAPEEIAALHEQGDFPIKSLPGWQQEIILKAINKVPELRFQSVRDFAEAIQARHVPLLMDKEAIRAGQVAERAEQSLSARKWAKAGSLLEFAAQKYPTNVNVLRALGRYHLLRQQIPSAKRAFEAALKLNPRLDVQKDLGWINLALKDYPAAISLLSDHLHRNPSDLEAHNLLVQCFYETDRYEVAIELARAILALEPANPCFANNYYIASLLHNLGRRISPEELFGGYTNDFIKYNVGVVAESLLTHAWQKTPTLKSKLLFMDYRFRKLAPNTLFVSDAQAPDKPPTPIRKVVITCGRAGYAVNDLQFPGRTTVSRRHCLIVNCRQDVWLYDLASTGTFVNGERVHSKALLIGRNTVRIGEAEFVVTTDKDGLL